MAKGLDLMAAAVGQMTMTAGSNGRQPQQDSIAEPSSTSEDVFHPDSIFRPRSVLESLNTKTLLVSDDLDPKKIGDIESRLAADPLVTVTIDPKSCRRALVDNGQPGWWEWYSRDQLEAESRRQQHLSSKNGKGNT